MGTVATAARSDTTIARIESAAARLAPLPLLWSYLLGVVAAGSLPQLPPLSVPLSALLSLLLAALFRPSWRRPLALLAVFCCGATWGLWQDWRALDQRLPLAQHGADFMLPLEVVSLPQLRPAPGALDGSEGSDTNIRFSARILAEPGDSQWPAVPSAMIGQRLDLTWYRAPTEIQQGLRAGSRWQLPVRLKHPHGSVNPHTFDYEGWLLRRGVYATGYVRPRDAEPHLLGPGRGLAVWRQQLRDALEAQGARRTELLSALLLGDRGGLTRAERRLLQQTGTAHLLAISGLHVGLVAGCLLLIGGAVARLVGLLSGRTPSWLPTAAALLGSGVYTLLAGAPLSARRALVMIWVLLLAWQWRRRVAPALAFSLALALVLTLQPLAFYDAGFWLSFVAVGALLLRFSRRLQLDVAPPDDGQAAPPVWRVPLQRLLDLLRSQWVIFLALLLPSLFFFAGFSAGGALVNLVAIPWMGLVILPALMLGALLLATPVGHPLLLFAGWQLDLLMAMLARSQTLAVDWQPLGLPLAIPGILLASGCVLLVILPRGLPGRHLGWLFALPLLLPWIGAGNRADELQVTALDVGQGLAVVARTVDYRLVYDTGPRSASGWSAGSGIVAPYLLGEGVRAADTVVISHGDLDHAGGLDGLLQSIDAARLVAPGGLAERYRKRFRVRAEACVAGASERHGALEIDWLWPPSAAVSGQENDHSCVALLRWRGVRILLSGDISRHAEQKIVAANPGLAPVDLLIAPHHGSRSSSSDAFVRWARPRYTIFSAGFHHHFGHPHAEVVARYRRAGAQIFNTADSGAVSLRWRRGGTRVEIGRAREAGAFWLRDSSVAPWWLAQ